MLWRKGVAGVVKRDKYVGRRQVWAALYTSTEVLQAYQRCDKFRNERPKLYTSSLSYTDDHILPVQTAHDRQMAAQIESKSIIYHRSVESSTRCMHVHIRCTLFIIIGVFISGMMWIKIKSRTVLGKFLPSLFLEWENKKAERDWDRAIEEHWPRPMTAETRAAATWPYSIWLYWSHFCSGLIAMQAKQTKRTLVQTKDRQTCIT